VPGPPGGPGPAGPPGPTEISADANNQATLGSDSLIYVPKPVAGSSVTVSDTAPASPKAGDLWWDSVGGQLYVWFNDANSSQWVVANNSGSAARVTIGDVAPPSPNVGDMWFDSVGAQTYIWFSDANSSQWVIANNFSGGAYLPKQGVTDGSDAPTGQIGEVISSVVTTGVTLATNVIANVSSISLTPGDWDVQGEVWINFGTGGGTSTHAYINTASAIPNPVALGTARFSLLANFAASGFAVLPLSPSRASLSATTTYYLITLAAFPSGTTTATGKIWARRVR
jgi:hypothetical protein